MQGITLYYPASINCYVNSSFYQSVSMTFEVISHCEFGCNGTSSHPHLTLAFATFGMQAAQFVPWQVISIPGPPTALSIPPSTFSSTAFPDTGSFPIRPIKKYFPVSGSRSMYTPETIAASERPAFSTLVASPRLVTVGLPLINEPTTTT